MSCAGFWSHGLALGLLFGVVYQLGAIVYLSWSLRRSRRTIESMGRLLQEEAMRRYVQDGVAYSQARALRSARAELEALRAFVNDRLN